MLRMVEAWRDRRIESVDRALAKRLPPGRVLREALRQRVIVACALGDAPAESFDAIEERLGRA